jgi:hypothetical protein
MGLLAPKKCRKLGLRLAGNNAGDSQRSRDSRRRAKLAQALLAIAQGNSPKEAIVRILEYKEMAPFFVKGDCGALFRPNGVGGLFVRPLQLETPGLLERS